MPPTLEIDTAALKELPGLWGELHRLLGPNALAFLGRVYAGGLGKYQRRLQSLGFAQRGCVLDAGCGLGQWSLSLAGMCRQVLGLDISRERVAACQKLSQAVNCPNLAFSVGILEALPFPDACFDAAVCYSVLYLTDYRRALPEIGRTLRPGGLFYLSTNGLGRFLYDIIKRPNPAPDFDPRRYGLLTLKNTILGRRSGLSAETGAVAMNRGVTVKVLQGADFEVLAVGPEGRMGGAQESFVPGKFWGLDSAFDVLARKV